MNRFEMARRVLLLEAAAAECKRRAAEVRAGLDEQARKELAEQGTAPTWRVPDVGTLSLPVSQETVYVKDEAALLAFVKTVEMDTAEAVETVERIKPWYIGELLKAVRVADGQVIDDLGTVIPGLAVRPGGQPMALSFRPNHDAKQVAAEAAGKLVDELAAGFGIEATP